MVTFSVNLMAIVCVIANLFFIDQNDIIVHYKKVPNLGVCNLKGPRPLPKIAKKIPGPMVCVCRGGGMEGGGV